MNRLHDLVEPVSVSFKTVCIVLAATGKVRRNQRVLNFIFTARNDSNPRHSELFCGGEQHDIVNTDQVRLEIAQYGRQILFCPLCRINNRFPALFHIVVNLLIRREIEIRYVSINEIRPIFRHLFGRHILRKSDDPLFESIIAEHTGKTRVREKHTSVSKFSACLRNSNGIECGSECTFRKKGNCFLVAHC